MKYPQGSNDDDMYVCIAMLFLRFRRARPRFGRRSCESPTKNSDVERFRMTDVCNFSQCAVVGFISVSVVTARVAQLRYPLRKMVPHVVFRKQAGFSHSRNLPDSAKCPLEFWPIHDVGEDLGFGVHPDSGTNQISGLTAVCYDIWIAPDIGVYPESNVFPISWMVRTPKDTFRNPPPASCKYCNVGNYPSMSSDLHRA